MLFFQMFIKKFSCDDTAVAVVRSDGRILASRRFADREALISRGGVEPAFVAIQVINNNSATYLDNYFI